MAKRIITISREFGSGGRFIGEEVAKKLGIAYYDKDIIGKIADHAGLSPEYVQESSELSPRKGLFAYAFTGRDATGKSMGDIVYEAQRKVILDIAEKESCVIIGRCADYVLDGTEGLIRVFLYADIKVREERVRERNLYADKDVLKNIHRIDRERRDYNRYYAGRDWEKPENYDLLINTTQIGVDGSVQLIKDYLKMRGLL